jgi:hypothetical protein
MHLDIVLTSRSPSQLGRFIKNNEKYFRSLCSNIGNLLQSARVITANSNVQGSILRIASLGKKIIGHMPMRIF